MPATVIDGVDPGADYSLSVFPLTAAGHAGPRKSVTMHGTNLILSAPRHATHKRVTITVTLRAAKHGAPLGKRQIALYGRRKGTHGAYGLITTLTTRAGSGRAKVTFVLKKSVDVIARFNGKATYIGSSAGPLTILL